MDRKTFNLVASARIDEFSRKVPQAMREEFVQDMWVHLLEHKAFDLFEADKGNLGSLLNIILFRAQVNWIVRHRMRDRVETTDPAQLDELPAPERTPQAFDADVAIRRFRESLSTAFNEETVERIIAAIEGNTPLAEIARSVGKTPQAFHYYVKRTRQAA